MNAARIGVICLAALAVLSGCNKGRVEGADATPPSDTVIQGWVFDTAGKPVSGAALSVRTGASEAATTTDEHGIFKLTLSPKAFAELPEFYYLSVQDSSHLPSVIEMRKTPLEAPKKKKSLYPYLEKILESPDGEDALRLALIPAPRSVSGSSDRSFTLDAGPESFRSAYLRVLARGAAGPIKFKLNDQSWAAQLGGSLNSTEMLFEVQLAGLRQGANAFEIEAENGVEVGLAELVLDRKSRCAFDLAEKQSAAPLANIVWGCNIVWGNYFDNIVWGNRAGLEFANVVWGTRSLVEADNIVWGTRFASAENIVWGERIDLDNIVWGERSKGEAENIVWGERTSSEQLDSACGAQ